METAKQVLERAAEAWNKRDAEGFAAVASPDLHLTGPGGREREGAEGWRQHYGEWMTAFPDNVVTHRNVVGDGADVIAEATFTGTHLGVMHTEEGDVPPTGKRMHMEFIEALRTQGGKVTTIRFYYDRLELMAQLGLLPTPTRR